MKKMTAFLMMMAMCFTLVACGGPDTQPAIDAFNSASDVYDRLVNTLNANADEYPQELFDVMNEMADAMLEHKEILESGEELTEEQIAEMIEVFGKVEAWALDTEANLSELKIKWGDKQAVIDAFNKTSTAFDELIDIINADIESYDQESLDLVNQMINSLLEIKEGLESDKQFTEDEVSILLEQLAGFEEWVAEAKEALVAVEDSGAGNKNGNEAVGETVTYVDKQPVIEAFNLVSPMFDATATAVNANIEAFSSEFITTLTELSGIMTDYKTVLESDYQLTQEEYNAMMESLSTIEQWLLEIESQVFG